MPNPGLSNDMNHKYHLNFHHIRSAQSNRQLSKSPYSQCLSPGVMASMEAATSIYLGSNQQPDQNGQFSCSNHQISKSRQPLKFSLHCVSKYVILQNLTVLNLQSYQIDLTFCNFAKSISSSCNLLDQPINTNSKVIGLFSETFISPICFLGT